MIRDARKAIYADLVVLWTWHGDCLYIYRFKIIAEGLKTGGNENEGI